MRKAFRLAAIVAAVSFSCGQAICAEGGTVLWPDVNGKMVRIPIAYTYAQCRKNGHNLGYPDSQSHDWCSKHCDGTICK
jgi:hypothetical protein